MTVTRIRKSPSRHICESRRVETRILNMLEKTGLRKRAELAVRAREDWLGILSRRMKGYMGRGLKR